MPRAKTRGLEPPLSGSRSFQRQKPFLPLKTPAISRELTISSNDSMTRDRHRDLVRGASPGHSTSRRRLPNRPCNLLIGPSLPASNLLQRLPDLALKHGGLHGQRQEGCASCSGEALQDCADLFLQSGPIPPE